ncbi:MAG: hypothetical protein E5Y88_33580 [Mesorhizobium sp.]|uniref:hypothetical protein n=1 Tax=Mesorhizobium sp. TaxID=1871066 RepID=UPI001218EA41|nr:hypothetical protein [Mesorhizobium sp.]TIL19409.1 MAG: hypothetical protein E5Y88_33580 [Mesorhizobium sp.]
MIESKLQFLLPRGDSTCDVARFTVFAIDFSLYHDVVLDRTWARIKSLARQPDAGEGLEAWLARKIRHGVVSARVDDQTARRANNASR